MADIRDGIASYLYGWSLFGDICAYVDLFMLNIVDIRGCGEENRVLWFLLSALW